MGMLPGFFRNQPPQRQPVNPLDKCTIVSVFPKDIYDSKPMVFPGVFAMKAAKENDFNTLIVGPSSWWKEMEEGQPPLEIIHSSIQMAESFIKDYCAQIGVEYGSKMPGLFFVPGAVSKDEILKKYSNKLDEYRDKQKEFFHNLVKLADIMFARTNGNPITISDDARLAANYLGMKDKPWLLDYQTMEKSPCKFCGEFINPKYPVCKHCHCVIDVELANKMNIRFTEKQ
jgi:hypothetical protein